MLFFTKSKATICVIWVTHAVFICTKQTENFGVRKPQANISDQPLQITTTVKLINGSEDKSAF